MSDRFRDLKMFVRVAETGSFSRTARELGYTQPSVSRIISTFEARLGAKLLVRTTRRVTLTDAGRALLERARSVLADLEDAENAARGNKSLSGILRVAVPVTFGARVIAPQLGLFLDRHPTLSVELLMSERRVDLVEEGVDLAIRLGPLDDSSFVAKRLGSARTFAVASPAYVRRHGAPRVPQELTQHQLLLGSAIGKWTFADAQGAKTSVRVSARMVATSTEGLLASAVAGLGIIAVSEFAARDEICRKRLVQLLGDYSMHDVEVHAITPLGRDAPPKVRAFADFVAGLLAERESPRSQ
ncbi:MAG: LysR family transcriptional regulator [Sphingomicrobium sp.]